MDTDSADIADLSLEEKIAFLEEELPQPVRDFLHSPERDAVSLSLSQKYSLHADQAAAFEQAYLYMLLGVNNPDEFVQDLKDARLTPEIVRGLSNDVNEQVFKKLQHAQLTGNRIPAPTRPIERPAPAVPVMNVVAQPAPLPVPPAAPPAFNLVQAPTISLPRSPEIRTMHSDMEMLQHPEAPHPSQISPARTFQTASVPYATLPTQSIPVQAPLQPIQPFVPAPAPISQAPAPRVTPPNPGYGADPYRESF